MAGVLLHLPVMLFVRSTVYSKVPDSILSQKASVVTISIYEGERLVQTGTGFIIDSSGIVATNSHVVSPVIDNPKLILAVRTVAGKTLKVLKLLLVDKKRDVSLLKVEGLDLPAVTLFPFD